jgi:aminoglycoside phosphotransferase (APT) family kinase protein
LAEEPDVPQREAAALRALDGSSLPVPRLLASDPVGEAAGEPATLMTRVPGRVDLNPGDLDRWLRQMAAMLPVIHDIRGAVRPYVPWFRPDRLEPPPWSRRRDAWQAAIDIVRSPPPPTEQRFIHRDYQHFNVLWQRGRLTGIVDWPNAGLGPREIDTGHCRLNLATLYSAEVAERFRLMYEAEAGRPTEPYWELCCLVGFLPGWSVNGLVVQAMGQRPVEAAAMRRNVEDLLLAVLARV